MKRKILFIILCIAFSLAIFYLQFSREPTVFTAVNSNDSEGSELTLTIIMNKIVLFDEEKTQQDLINRILNNEFDNMLFSYDVMGYPKKLVVDVYTNDLSKNLGIPAFRFRYAPEH